MALILTSILSVLLYLTASAIGLSRFSRGQPVRGASVRALGGAALALHAWVAASLLVTPTGMNLGVFVVLSGSAAVVAGLALLGSFFRPLDYLLTLLFPLCAGALGASLVVDSDATSRTLSAGLLSHIAASVLAWAVLCIAAGQALLIAYQDRQLRHSRSLAVLRALPPLTEMEELLFQFVWFGMALLSISIVTGLLFLDDMFAQHVVHHTVLSLTSWGVFAVLLWGRHALGWRGRTAIRWTLAGFVLLALAWIGSKVVIELILQNR